MSVPELKTDPATGIIYLHWTAPGAKGERGRSKRQSTRTRDMAAAKAYLGEWLLMERTAPAETAAVLTCGEIWAAYEARHLEKKTAAPAGAKYAWKNLSRHFSDLTPAQIDDDVVETYVARRTSGRLGLKAKASTVRKELLMLRASWGWAAGPKVKLLVKATIPEFEIPPEGEARKVWLRREQKDKLLAAAAALPRVGGRTPRVERFLWLAVETAARKTAIYQLTWDRVDFDTGMIDYDVPGRVRTKKRRAQVPMSPALREQMLKWYEERVGDYVLDHGAEVWASVQSVARKAGLGPEQRVATGKKPKATGVSPHVLRHTAATYMLLRGVPPWTVAGILGNSEEMVRKVYGHLCNEAAREAVAQISGDAAADSDMALLAAIRSGKFKLVENV
jgi:integrase